MRESIQYPWLDRKFCSVTTVCARSFLSHIPTHPPSGHCLQTGEIINLYMPLKKESQDQPRYVG